MCEINVNRNTSNGHLRQKAPAFSVILLSLLLAACTSNNVEHKPSSGHVINHGDLVCNTPDRFKGQVIGDGHCVSLIKHCTQAPVTSRWRPGDSVIGSKVLPGTVIATFKNGRYPNVTGHHAAIFIEQDDRGIWVWDQWLGKPVHKRLIRKRPINEATPGNTAQFYRVVKLAD